MATITQHFAAKKTRGTRDVKSEKSSLNDEIKVESVKDTKIDAREEDMKKLKDFDLQWQLGPCTGVTRLDRWERASKHGLNPSQSIRDLILAHLDDKDYTESLWHEYEI